jgi:hypothetical protein
VIVTAFKKWCGDNVEPGALRRRRDTPSDALD